MKDAFNPHPDAYKIIIGCKKYSTAKRILKKTFGLSHKEQDIIIKMAKEKGAVFN